MRSTTLPPSSSSSSLPKSPLSPISPTSSFTHHLPKIELHAHLTGSIRPETLHTIWSVRRHHHHHDQQLDPSISPGLQDDPLTVLAPTARFDVKTFFPLFSKYIYRLVNTKDTVIATTNAVLEDFCADGVVYLELRTTPREIAGPEGEGGGGGGGKECYIRTVLDCITNFTSEQQRRLQGATGDDNNKGGTMMMMVMSTYLILSIDRRNTAAEAMQVVDLAIKYRDRGVVGVDLCGDPCKGDVSVFRDAFAKAKAAGLGVTLHFAEVGRGVEDGEGELRTLLDFRPDRVGHVCHPGDSIRQAVLDRGLGVELCVSCNVMAGLTEGGVGEHHFGWWWEKGAKVVLCTDDVGVFGSSLSNEYHIVAKAFELGKQDLLRLARKPIECVFGPETERKRLDDIFDKFEVMQDGQG